MKKSMCFNGMELPVASVVPELNAALRDHGGAVLTAPPGAGKTTLVPLALVDEPWLAGKKIVLLEPRRLAARAAAERMAGMLGEKVGETVGYRMRMDTRVGRKTRIEVVTEGILTRRLQNDPALGDVGLVIFDEFHERSLHADLGLAFTEETRAALREDLRVLVMSATLDPGSVGAFLGDVPLVNSTGRSFPVTTRYLETHAPSPGWDPGVERRIVSAVINAVNSHGGGILVFLPGEREIRWIERRLREVSKAEPELAKGTVAPLYGSLPAKMQDQALVPPPPGGSKIVLATSIAETSLTIEGITVVIDCGFMRVPRFSPGTGMNRLETVRVTKASADQRRGRAGRLQGGFCYRLWTEGENRGLVKENPPEIMGSDLTPLALELAAWGVSNPDRMAWLDSPPGPAFMQARKLLFRLGALDGEGRITSHGKRIAGIGVHPRLGHMILEAAKMGAAREACELAAILGEGRVITLPKGGRDSDLGLRLEALRDPAGVEKRGIKVNRRALSNIRRTAGLWEKKSASPGGAPPGNREGDGVPGMGVLLATAYPDRVGKKRPGGEFRYVLSGGRGAYFPGFEPMAEETFIVAPALDGKGKEALIHLAAPIREQELLEHFTHDVTRHEVVTWNPGKKCVEAVNEKRFGSLVLQRIPAASPDREAVARAMMEGIRGMGLSVLPWSATQQNLRARVHFLSREGIGEEAWPDLSEGGLLDTMEDWLYPFLPGITGKNRLGRVDLNGALSLLLPRRLSVKLDRYAPTHIRVPSGSRIPVDYTTGGEPVLSVRLQEMFGLGETPRIGGGAYPLLLHLLSPAGRPLQVTKDLGGFWAGSYEAVKKEMKGRYPKHHWPDNPLLAQATSRAKQRRRSRGDLC